MTPPFDFTGILLQYTDKIPLQMIEYLENPLCTSVRVQRSLDIVDNLISFKQKT